MKRTALLVAHAARAQHAGAPEQPAPDSAGVIAAAQAFGAAVAAGDRAAVEALLLPEALVLESGGAQTRAEYLAHHLAADAAFLAATRREAGARTARVAGDAAWVASTNRARGTYRGREVDASSAELLVLRRTGVAWRVAAVHWSSGR